MRLFATATITKNARGYFIGTLSNQDGVPVMKTEPVWCGSEALSILADKLDRYERAQMEAKNP